MLKYNRVKELILIKLGGSVITDKSKAYYAREENIARLAGEVRQSLRLTGAKITIGHGAGSFAHIPAHKYKTKEGIVGKDSVFGASVTEEAARFLNQLVIKKFVSEKVPVFPFSPGSFIISNTKVYSKSYLDPIEKALDLGIVPVVYGDVVLDKKIGFTIFSTEKILSILANEFNKKYKIRMIFVTDVDGVLDEKGELIPEITKANFGKLKTGIAGAKGVDVTGGMLHKVEEALVLAGNLSIKTQIINGLKSGRLKKAILGDNVEGTLVS